MRIQAYLQTEKIVNKDLRSKALFSHTSQHSFDKCQLELTAIFFQYSQIGSINISLLGDVSNLVSIF